MLYNLWLNKTDKFLCNNIKNTFEQFEKNYKNKNQTINLAQELQNLQSAPFVNISTSSTNFEKDVKLKLKLIVGVFFVFIPLISFLLLSYILETHVDYAVISTLAVAIFASFRMDLIATKYSTFRHSLI